MTLIPLQLPTHNTVIIVLVLYQPYWYAQCTQKWSKSKRSTDKMGSQTTGKHVSRSLYGEV